MKLFKSSLILLFLVLVIPYGCNEKHEEQSISSIHKLSDLSENKLPVKIKLDPNSLIVKVPGQDGVELPTEVVSEIPAKIEYLGFEKTIPGTTMLKQSVKERLMHEVPEISKKPVVIDFNGVSKERIVPLLKSSPNIVKVLPSLTLEYSDYSNSKQIAIERNLIEVIDGDTIFPAISILSESPVVTIAQPFNYKENAQSDISVIETYQDLPNPFIRSIAMDKDGIMWFESHTGGLIAYDGQFFFQYSDKRRLAKHPGLSMIIDSKGNIWTGTKGGGVYCFDGTYNTNYTKEQGLISNNVLDILEDSKGNIWLTTNKGVVKYDGSSFVTYTEDNGLGLNYVFTVFEDNIGNIWFGTFGGGVSMFNGNEFITYTIEDGLCHNTVLSVAQDYNGNYWFGTYGGGVSRFDGESFINYSIEQGLENNIVLAITEDKDNNLWFGTHGGGATYFDGEAFINYSTEEGLSFDYIRTIVEDDKGNLWMGTDGSGITKINLNGFNHYVEQLGLVDNNITAIYQDNLDRLCFAPFEDGVVIFDKLTEPGKLKQCVHINAENGLAHNIVVSISQDKDHNYWFGTYYGGVSKLDISSLKQGQLKFTNYSDSSGLNHETIRMIMHDHEGNIWFATEGGATKYDGHSFTTITKENGLGDNIVTSIFQDSKNRIWFSTMDGGVSYLLNDTLVRYTKQHGLGSNTVWVVTEDKNGIIWFGTSNGVTGFDGNAFRTLNMDNGIVNNKVYSLVVDNNNDLWVGTIKGLSQVKLPEESFFEDIKENKPVISNYGRMDGLIGLDFTFNSVFLDNMNCLWWGTDKTLTMLDLSKFKSYNVPPVPHLNGVIINNENLDFSKVLIQGNNNPKFGIRFSEVSPFLSIPIGLSLPSDMNYISFSFSATDWSSPNQMQYQYMIEGFDDDWSLLTEDNTADYRNIPPGKYKFILKARGRSDMWSENLEYSFEIRKPWYQTWWSIIIDLLLLGIFIWGIVKWRVSIVQRQKATLAAMVVERTKDLDKALVLAEQAAEAKSQFIATISHELRTPLNAIMGLTHIAINSTTDNTQEDYLQKIDRSAMTLLSLINEILDFSKIEAGKMKLESVNFDLEMVINSIIELNSQAAKDKNLELVINVDQNIPEKLIGDPLRIGQIITNLCNNAIKFTNEGEIIINIEIEEEVNKEELFLQVSVVDSGIGISEDQKQSLFEKFKQADTSTTRKYGGTGLGLTICKLLIEMMDGQIWLESEVGIGTTFSFDFKVGVQKDQTPETNFIPEELKQYSILVCDDNKGSLDSLSGLLEKHSLQVDRSTSGEEVLELLTKKQYDLLIIDLELKGISGLDTILSIRANEDLPSIKTILLTDSIKGKESFERNISGIDGYILKPTTSSVLIDEVLSVFGMKSPSSIKSKTKTKENDKTKEQLKGSSILLVEDNELNQQVIIELLRRVGVVPELAVNGAQALQKTVLNRYDLILMDLHMPVMDGYNSTRQIREKGISTPVIAITADAMGSVKQKSMDVGINDIITKPIKPSLLYDRIVYWITGSSNNDLSIDSESSNSDSYGVSKEILDISSGITRLGGDKQLYFKMLNKFINTVQDTHTKIKETIELSDGKQSHLLAHSLKGESGNIGANKVSEHAAKIESYIKDKQYGSDLERELEMLKNSIEQLNQVFNENKLGDKMDSSSDTSKQLSVIVQELMESLKLKNPNVFDLLDELEDCVANPSEYALIKKAIINDEVENALKLLKKLS